MMWLPASPHIGSMHVFGQGLAERDSYRAGVKYGHKYPAPHVLPLDKDKTLHAATFSCQVATSKGREAGRGLWCIIES